MSYLQPEDPNLLNDIAKRKEFYQYNLPPVADGEREVARDSLKFLLERLEEEDIHLDLNSYQAMVSNLFSPNTPYSRMLLQWDPGMGKTIAAIDMAMRHIRLFERESEMEDQNNIGSVTIIGFTEDIFKRELISFPKYGFVNREELRQLQQLRHEAFQGNKTDSERVQEFVTKLRKRLTSRRNNGYFRFFGYKAFVNRIFMLQDSSKNINEMSEDDIRKALKDGSLKWNRPLLDSFKNSLLICDEIHDVYNSLEKNNWGIAIQMVLDHHPSLKALFMSATPLNNSPTEIVDLCNLLNVPSRRVTKAQLFTKDGQLLPGSLDKIAALLRGKVSFVQDTNPDQFATQTIEGEVIQGVKYLKFIRCPMSKFHYNTYQQMYTGALSQDAQYLVDIAFPNPNDSKVGLFKTTDIKKILGFAEDAWVQKNGAFKYQNDLLVGPGFDQSQIGKWSAKYERLLEEIKSLLRPNAGKVFVYHNVVHISGVLFIEQLLQQNGFISVDQSETAGTLCSICGNTKGEHPADGAAGGAPAEITMIRAGDATLNQLYEASALVDEHKWAPRSWFALRNGHVIGAIEYTEPDGGFHISHCVVLPSERKQGVGSYMLQTTMPPFHSVTVDVLKPNSEARDWFAKMNFHLLNDDEQYWFFEWPYDTPFVGGGARAKADKSKKASVDHKFMAARYVMAHSDMDKTIMQKNIDRFNSPDNTDGYMYKLIVGSKIIRQSYNFKSIRWQYIVGRPDNISILLQILGRARRRGSHSKLPPALRRIVVKILTSCIPEKDPATHAYKLSHEEMKYRDKVADYQVIQQIEKVMHENAVDAVIARSIIEPSLDPENKTLGALYYKPAVQARTFKLGEINMSTFDAFQSDDEVNMIIYILKRLFIEVSLVFKFDELWDLVRKPPFKMQINTALFSLANFVIALDMLIYNDKGASVQPLQNNNNGENPDQLFLLDLLHNTVDNRIIMPDKSIGYVHYIQNQYIFIPMRESTHIMAIESPFRVPFAKKARPINILKYIRESSTIANYDNRKLKFKAKYAKVPLEKLATAIGKFGAQFHSQFVEEIIKYVFNVWTNPTMTEKSEYHEFYFKMLYFYDLMGLIVWASTAKEYIKNTYKDWLLGARDAKRAAKILQLDNGDIESLSKSLSRSKAAESLRVSKTEFYNSLKLSLQVIRSRSDGKKPSRPSKAESKTQYLKAAPNLLPIGHFLGNVPKFYHPEKDWYESPEYVQRTQEFKENSIIIGYYEKSPTGLRIKFKIRNPIHLIKKHKDIRMIEKGSICSSNSKTYLMDVAKKLGIELGDKINVPNLCNEIESKLIMNELNERRRKSNIKWFYSFWETRPDERRPTSSPASST